MPVDMTGSALFISANCTEDPKHAPLACSLFPRFQEEHPRSSVLFPPIFVCSCSARHVLAFTSLNKTAQANLGTCLRIIPAVSMSKRQVTEIYWFAPGTSCIPAWVQQECWCLLGADREGKNQNFINIWREASRFVQSWVEMTSLLCYCFSD